MTLTTIFLLAGVALAGDWSSYRGDAQLSGWQRYGKEISVSNAGALKLLWKKALEGSASSSPVIIGPTITHRGVRELVFVQSQNDLYAFDADLGALFWNRHFDSSSVQSTCGVMPLPPTPVIQPDPHASTHEEDEPGPMRPLYAVTPDGKLHTIRVSDGADSAAPVDFLPPGAAYTDLTYASGTVYSGLTGKCAGQHGVWHIDIKKSGAKPVFSPSLAPPLQGIAGSYIRNGFARSQDPSGAGWVFGANEREVKAFKVEGPPDKPGLKLAWTLSDLEAPGPPVVANGVVFVLASDALQAIDASTGKVLWSSAAVIEKPASYLAVANGHICFTAGAFLYCFGVPMER